MITRIASLAVGLGVLVGFLYYIGINSIVNLLLTINPLVIVAMVGLQLFGFGFYSAAWYQLILAAGYSIRFRSCLGIALASIFAVYVMPSGVFMEVLRCILGSKETGMPFGESTASVVLHRILYIIGFLASSALALFFVLTDKVAGSVSVFALAAIPVATIVGLGVLLYFSLDPTKISPGLERVLKFAQPVIRLVQREAVVEGRANQFLGEYDAGFKRMMSSRRRMVESFASSLGDWCCSVAILGTVLYALDSNVSVWVVVITISIGRMIQMTPIAIPGMIGVYETAVTTVLVLFGVPVSVAASAAILSRIVTVWLELPITGVAAYHYGFKLLGKGTVQV
jgi:uncharacterized protein (TIRG00374 family)